MDDDELLKEQAADFVNSITLSAENRTATANDFDVVDIGDMLLAKSSKYSVLANLEDRQDGKRIKFYYKCLEKTI